jgi:hypothetical protein
MRIATLLDQIDSGSLLLPEFQRGFVWTRDKIRRFMRSMYLGYPVGGILLWESDVSKVPLRGSSGRHSGLGSLVLDGQQRLTTLYSLARGNPPEFFDGDPGLFQGLHFHLEDQKFQFFGTPPDTSDSLWIDVGRLMRKGVASSLDQVQGHPARATDYLGRLNRLSQIVERTLPTDLITGPEFGLDSIVDIFNQVNSGGTKLSKADLALARICASTPDARKDLRAHTDRLSAAGCAIEHDLLLRCVTAVATGRASLTALDSLTADAFRYALKRTPEYVQSFMHDAADRLGIGNEHPLPGRSALPVIARWYDSIPGSASAQAHDGALYWYLRCVLQDHYGRSTETVLNRDLATLDRSGLTGLLKELDREIGGPFRVEAVDLDGSTIGSRSYTLISILSNIRAAGRDHSDRGTNTEQRSAKPRHLFAKKQLRDMGWPAKAVNSNANICFLPESSATQLEGGTTASFLFDLERRFPGSLARHCIPKDHKLWQPIAYLDFLEARKVLLAEALQEFLESLRPRRETLRHIEAPASVA